MSDEISRMNNQRSSLPNVDRANSTLFKRYLDEQRKSILKTNFHSTSSRPITNSFHLHQDEENSTKQSNVVYPTVHVRKKSSNGRKFSLDPSKQRSSHASRFMKRFQRQNKYGESTIKRDHFVDRRPRLEFYPPAAPLSNVNETQENNCQCQTIDFSRPSVPTTTVINDQSIENHDVPTISSTIQIEPTTFFIDPIQSELSDQHYLILNDLLQDLSNELTDKTSVDILLEIEGSLAQRIYDCVVEHDEENDEEIHSHSTTTADSLVSVVPMNNKSNDLPPSPINDHREKYFQPIREPLSPPTFDQRHSTPFNSLSKPLTTDLQNILEPVHLLRTVTRTNSNQDDNEHWNIFNGFETNFYSINHNTNQQTLPFVNHLLLPRSNPIDSTRSAFKPIESRSFVFQRPSNWFGQSQD